MKLISIYAENFGPYKEFSFSPFDSLQLIQGKTGSGKSTIPDIVCWALFGITAKDGKADEVIPWWEPNAITHTVITLNHNGILYLIERWRSNNSSKNDLRYSIGEEDYKRGKNITETQCHINEAIGFSSHDYLMSSYFCEFSPTANFFLSDAKNKRKVFEGIVDLSFPVLVAEKSAEAKKKAKAELAAKKQNRDKLSGAVEQLIFSLKQAEIESCEWEKVKDKQIKELNIKYAEYESTRQDNIKRIQQQRDDWEEESRRSVKEMQEKLVNLNKIECELQDIEDQIKEAKKKKCPSCNTPIKYSNLMEKKLFINNNLTQLKSIKEKLGYKTLAVNPFESKLLMLEKDHNPFYSALKEQEKSENPYLYSIGNQKNTIEIKNKQLYEADTQVNNLIYYCSSLSQIYEFSFALRAKLLDQIITRIEDSTNTFLERHFDSEMRISFSVLDGDSIDVSITKNGNPCVYKQLSKGQRQLLKLCFATSVMQSTADNLGINFDTLWFDEALDGLDTELKLKAFSLFEEIQKVHQSVLIIEHSTEFSQLFFHKHFVTLDGDESSVSSTNA